MPKTHFKKIEYWFGDFFGNFFLTLSLLIFRVLSPTALVSLAKILGTMAFYLNKKYRERVFSNLSLAFGREKNLTEMTRLAKEVFFNFTLTPLETIYMVAVPFERSVKHQDKRPRKFGCCFDKGKRSHRSRGPFGILHHVGDQTCSGGLCIQYHRQSEQIP